MTTKIKQTQLRQQFHLTQFDKSGDELFDFEISACEREIPNKQLGFSLTVLPSNYS